MNTEMLEKKIENQRNEINNLKKNIKPSTGEMKRKLFYRKKELKVAQDKIMILSRKLNEKEIRIIHLKEERFCLTNELIKLKSLTLLSFIKNKILGFYNGVLYRGFW